MAAPTTLSLPAVLEHVRVMSDASTAEQMRVGWTWCLEGVAEHLGATT